MAILKPSTDAPELTSVKAGLASVRLGGWVVHPKPLVQCFLAFHSISIAWWWILLVTLPPFADLFKPSTWPREAFFCFSLPDVLMLVVAPWIVIVAISQDWKWAGIGVWALPVVVLYPTLYCLLASLQTGEAWLATSAMTLDFLGATAVATIYGLDGSDARLFRSLRWSKPNSAIATLLQLTIFWLLFLWFLPRAIIELESAFFSYAWKLPQAPIVATLLFLCAASLGLSSAWWMAWRGSATPLPTASPQCLIVSGPYRYVRNPMALAGIVQGIAVGIGVGSGFVIAYALTGAILWHFCIRPFEEQDLLARFGEFYDQYRRSVPLWYPSFSSSFRIVSSD